jgi:hypothetical protein
MSVYHVLYTVKEILVASGGQVLLSPSIYLSISLSRHRHVFTICQLPILRIKLSKLILLIPSTVILNDQKTKESLIESQNQFETKISIIGSYIHFMF